MAISESADTLATITSFLNEIGLPTRAETLVGDTVLPGIRVERGAIFYDTRTLKYPGDLLHEAGHLAVKLPADRAAASAELGYDPAEEMMAIAWSYAAALHLQLPPEVVFHEAGYRNGSQSMLENFSEGRYLALPMLQWIGLTYDTQQAQLRQAKPYPFMQSWLRKNPDPESADTSAITH